MKSATDLIALLETLNQPTEVSAALAAFLADGPLAPELEALRDRLATVPQQPTEMRRVVGEMLTEIVKGLGSVRPAPAEEPPPRKARSGR